MRPEDTLGAARDSTAVCVLAERGPAATAAALQTVAERTPPDVPLLVLGVRERDAELVGHALDREVAVIAAGYDDSVGELLNRAVRATAGADILVLSATCRVPPEWLDRVRSAALHDDAVATATPLSSDGGTVGVFDGGQREPDRLIAAGATRNRPRLLIGGPHCVYLRRPALELVGGFPTGGDSLPAAIAAFCERCVQAGMVNILVDDVYVTCEQRPVDETPMPAAGLQEVDRLDERSALARSLSLASAVLGGLSVTIDARALGPAVGGTQRYTRELTLALARSGGLMLRVVVAPDAPAEVAAEIADAPGVELLDYEQAAAGVGRTHLVHRPQQVFSAADLELLQLLGRRVVITHQDLIAYHNPAYHESLDGWKQHRRITRIALTAADRVLFLSEHARRDAVTEDLVEVDRCDVVGVAVGEDSGARTRPAGAPQNGSFILCLGADYRHKNRRFAIALLGALRAEQGWQGKLVLAGGRVPFGSSRPDEEQLLAADLDLREAVVDLGTVDGPGRMWLLANAHAIVVPSVAEGFGLVPLEAAQHAIPCLYAPVSSLVEVVGERLAVLVPWSASDSARRAMPLLVDGPERRRHIEDLRAAAQRWRWDKLAAELLQSYERAMRTPYRPAAARAWQELERERYLLELHRGREHNHRVAEELRRAHEQLLQRLGSRITLISDERFLTAREQKGLFVVGERPALRRLMLWPFALVGSVSALRSQAERRDLQ